MCALGEILGKLTMNSIPAFHYSRPVSRNGVPGAPADFLLTEGWMGWDGWDGMDGMDGMVGQLFFFARILKTTTYFFLIVSVP